MHNDAEATHQPFEAQTHGPSQLNNNAEVFTYRLCLKEGKMKMNVDGSLREGMRGGIGGLIRNNQGEWVKGFYGSIHPCYSLEAELHAIYTGLSILKDLGWHGVGVETDCLVVLSLLKEPVDLTHPNYAMIVDCKSLVKQMQIEVKHVRRERNKAADRLAKIGADQHEELVLLDEYPHALESTLAADIHNAVDRICSMSGSDCMPSQHDDRGSCDNPVPVMHQVPFHLPPYPAFLEEELEIQHRDIQGILAENSHIVDENVILQRELTAMIDEIHRLNQIISNLHAEKDSKAMGLTALQSADLLRAEVLQLRSETQELNFLQQELSVKVETLTNDITRVQDENEDLVALKIDIDGMQRGLMEMRRDFEITRKANELQLVEKETMEKDLHSMAWEIEKLQAEKFSSERRPRGLGDGGYGMLNGIPDMRYPNGSAFSDVYGEGAWAPCDHRGPPRW